jgi:nucleotide-binding universal stress UspA family protein
MREVFRNVRSTSDDDRASFPRTRIAPAETARAGVPERKENAMKAISSFILCATDFSAHAKDAATVAAKLALRRKEKLRLVHAPRRAARRTRSNGSAELEEKLRTLVPSEAECGASRWRSGCWKTATVAKALCVEADRFGADVVCLASHGLGVSRGWHGSVAKAVLKRLKRPLLIIRRADE